MRLPPVRVVHRDLRVPLREVVVSPAAALPARDRAEPRLPREVHHQRIARRQRRRQREPRDRGVRGERVLGRDRHAADRDPVQSFVGVVRVRQVAEAVDLLAQLVVREQRVRAERVQVQVEVDLPERVRAVVAVDQAGRRGEDPRRLVEARRDRVANVLLEVRRRVRGGARSGGLELSLEKEQGDRHGGVHAGNLRPMRSRRRARAACGGAGGGSCAAASHRTPGRRPERSRRRSPTLRCGSAAQPSFRSPRSAAR